MGTKDKIEQYIINWENRCYKSGIPDEAPTDIFALVPSYKKIAVAILKNDHALKSLGYTPSVSKYYTALKYIELKSKGKLKSTQLTIW